MKAFLSSSSSFSFICFLPAPEEERFFLSLSISLPFGQRGNLNDKDEFSAPAEEGGEEGRKEMWRPFMERAFLKPTEFSCDFPFFLFLQVRNAAAVADDPKPTHARPKNGKEEETKREERDGQRLKTTYFAFTQIYKSPAKREKRKGRERPGEATNMQTTATRERRFFCFCCIRGEWGMRGERNTLCFFSVHHSFYGRELVSNTGGLLSPLLLFSKHEMMFLTAGSHGFRNGGEVNCLLFWLGFFFRDFVV